MKTEALEVVLPVAMEAQPDDMHPVVRAAIAQNPDAANLRELLEIQRGWEKDQARKAYTAAMIGLKADMPAVILKDAEVDFTGAKGRTHYRHASLAGAMDAVTPHLTRHGFSVSFVPATVDGKVQVTCRLTHSAGHGEEATLSAPADQSGGKNAVQAIASTTTLLQRYTALALLGIATAEHVEDFGPLAESVDIEKLETAIREAGSLADLERAGLAVKECASSLTKNQSADLKALYRASRDRIGGAS